MNREVKAGDLEELPNIGKSIASDLRVLGIHSRAKLEQRDPLEVYRELGAVMGRRYDPCVLYTLLSVAHFFACGQRLPWWKFTGEGKAMMLNKSP